MKNIILTTLTMAITAIGATAQEITDPDLIWDGSISSHLHVENKTIYIYTPADFIALHDLWDKYEDDGHHGYDGYTILLMNDIDLNNRNIQPLTIGWTDSHRFGGRFDGQGHTIKNVYIGGEEDDRGLFGWMCGGDVLNLKLVNVYIHAGDGGNEHVGALCGKMENHSLISHCAVINCTVSTWDPDDDDEVGVFCGYMANDKNVIEYCYTDATVMGDTQVGGIVGKVEKNDGDDKSEIHHCYFRGTIQHGDEYFGAIAGERYSNPVYSNFFLDRYDGVRATGNQEKYDGSSYHPDNEVKACTDEGLKAPLLFGADNTEWVYPLNGYPELKVFLRYNVGDTFYEKNIGSMDNNVVPGYLKIQKNEDTPLAVSLEKIMPGYSGSDFALNDNFTSYFSDKQLCLTGLSANIFENLGVVNTVTVPATIDSIAIPQRHHVQNAFILNGTVGAVKDGGLYSLKDKYFVTAPKTFTSLTIHQEFADQIVDYAFENMSNLRKLYVDTWIPAGTLVDDGDNLAPVIQLNGGNIFNGCPEDLDVYIKDGTSNQLFIGYQGPGGYGYSNDESGWMNFYSEYQDVENHMYSYFPINRNPGGMSTLILGYPVELPQEVTAWWAQSIGDETITFRKIGSPVVPALTPVLLTYEGTGPLYLSRYEGDNPGAATDYETNLLKGSVDPGGHFVTSSEMMSNFFTLGRPAGDSSYENLGFYQYHPKNGLLPSYVAWLAASDIPTGVKGFTFVFDDDDPIGILSPLEETEEEAAVYTLQGIRIDPSNMQKGTMYIVNGKKVLY